MNSLRKAAIALMTATAIIVAVGSTASAGGLLGGLIDTVTGTDIGTQLDRWNDQNGNVVDHAFAAIAEAYVPGSGQVIEGYYAYNRGGVDGLVQYGLEAGTDDESDDE